MFICGPDTAIGRRNAHDETRAREFEVGTFAGTRYTENHRDDFPVVLDFRLREPIIQAVGHNDTPISVGRYDISSEVYGEGLAEFVVASECEGTLDPTYGICLGTVHHNIRNSITFSDRGGL